MKSRLIALTLCYLLLVPLVPSVRATRPSAADPIGPITLPNDPMKVKPHLAPFPWFSIIFARSDGSNATNCNGTADVAYDGSGTGETCAYTLDVAITQAACTDTIKLNAAQTFDTSGGFTLPNKSCSSANPITITSTATLPNRTITPSDVSLMPRIRATSTNAIFTTAANAGGWTLDGLELTDNAGTANINVLVDFGSNVSGVHDIVFTRNYVHQKETGTDYERSIVRAVGFSGAGLDYTYNHVDIIGYPYGSTEPHNSEALLVGLGSDINFTYNYSKVWYNHLFLGGSGTAPNHTATLTSASTTSATFSSVTGLEVGAFVRFSITGTATLSNTGCTPTLTRLTGPAWVTADGNQNSNWGDSMLITSQADPLLTGITRLMNLTGDNVFTTTAANSLVCSIPNGTVDYVLYQTAKVTNIAGSVVTYDPLGTTNGIDYSVNALNKTPNSAAWNQDDEGRIVDVVVSHNTFETDETFATHLQGIGRGCPKGLFEIKNVDRFTFTYNNAYGYPAVMAFTAANQDGASPWITVDHVLIQHNYIHPSTGHSPCSRSTILMSDDAYLNTITPTSEVTISNNLVKGGIRSFLEFKQGGTWTVTHNTVINNQVSDFSFNVLVTAGSLVPNLIFKDNIGNLVCYGIQNYPANYASSTILNNVLIDVPACTGGVGANTYGTGSILTPIIEDFEDVGFTDYDAGIYSIPEASDYYNAGSDGTSPGVVWNTPGAKWLSSAVTVCKWSSGCVSQ